MQTKKDLKLNNTTPMPCGEGGPRPRIAVLSIKNSKLTKFVMLSIKLLERGREGLAEHRRTPHTHALIIKPSL